MPVNILNKLLSQRLVRKRTASESAVLCTLQPGYAVITPKYTIVTHNDIGVPDASYTLNFESRLVWETSQRTDQVLNSFFAVFAPRSYSRALGLT